MLELPDNFSRALRVAQAAFKLIGAVRSLVDGDDDGTFFPKDETPNMSNTGHDGVDAEFTVNEE